MSARLHVNRLELATFAGLAVLVAWRYAGVQARPPVARLSALVAIGLVAAAVMPAIHGRRAALARVACLAILGTVGLVTAGAPARLLAPSRWSTLTGRLGGGLRSIDTVVWPYSGRDAWTRTDLTLVLGAALLAAATLAFWPARRAARPRRIAALAVLLAAYVFGLLDSDGGSVAVEGLLLLALIAAWLWPRALGRGPVGAAVIWLAVAGALAAVLTVPLAGGEAWLGYRGWNLLGSSDRGIAFSWDQTYGPLRWSRSQLTMFTVSSPHSGLWKTTTLDRFDGTRFARSAIAAPGDEDLPLPLNNSWYRFVRFTIAGLRSRLLPTEQGVTAGVRTAVPVDYAPDGTVTTRREALPSGASYAVMSYVPDPSAADLRTAARALPAGYRRYTEFELPGPGGGSAATAEDWRLILASPYAPMYRLARGLARGRRNRYDVALSIERYLQGNDAYEERVPLRRYPLEAFLFTDHLGYCQQFSGAMALMLRMDGIPARIAAGFRPGSYDAAARRWVVRAVDAHSWVEVYFGGIGWVPFDPTPPRAQSAPRRLLFTSSRAAALTQMQAIAATVGAGPRAAATPPATPRPAGGGELWLVARALGLTLVLGLFARWVAGGVRLRRSLNGDGELATQELVAALHRLGYAIPPTATLSRVEGIVRLHGGADGARYVRRLRDRRYGPGSGGSVTLADRRRLRRALTVPAGLDARVRGFWAFPPATLGWGVKAQP